MYNNRTNFYSWITFTNYVEVPLISHFLGFSSEMYTNQNYMVFMNFVHLKAFKNNKKKD